jgi:hypothetical protein
MEYEAQWTEYRRRRRVFWLIFVTYIPGVFLIGVPLGNIFNSETPAVVTALMWMAAFAIAGWRTTYWRCPRCRKRFFATWYVNQFARKCVHCGLKKWATESK